MITIIAAVSDNGVIGIENQLPWKLPADFKHFKETTLHSTVIMGRKTFESIGKPLPDRINIVITRDTHKFFTGCITVHSLEAAIAKADTNKNIFIIGGEEIYKQSMDISDELNLTVVHGTFEGDAHFPKVDLRKWEKVSQEDFQPDDKNKIAYSFTLYKKRPINLIGPIDIASQSVYMGYAGSNYHEIKHMMF